MPRTPLRLAIALLLVLFVDCSSGQRDPATVREAADQGDAEAQNDLGGMYANGDRVPQDDAQAVAWFRKAADQGNADAQNNLGGMYDNGRGVPQDDAQAVAWYRQAADQGNAFAQANLGVMYANGEGVPQDDVEAHRWLSLATSRATGDRQKEYAATLDELAEALTPAQIAEAQKRAADWQAAFEQRQTD